MDRLVVNILESGSIDLSFFDAINLNWFYCAVVVRRNDKIIAGLCVYNNAYIKHDGNSTVLIGNIKCEDNSEVFSLLINETELIAKKLGAKCIIGPIDGSTWHAYRYSIREAEGVFSGDIVHDLYYNHLMLGNGFSVLHRYYSSVSEIQQWYDEELLPTGVTIRSINSYKFEDELRALHPMCVSAFADNELFSPIDEAGFVKKYIAFEKYLDTDYVQVAEDSKGIVALFFCYKGFYKEKPALIIKTIARHPERRYKGLVEMMAKKVFSKAYSEGIMNVVHAFMHEENRSLKLSAEYGGKKINEYAVYIKCLHD
ncbi:MAG: hypothetical protein J0L80_00905 [Chitinophagales bacterium]|nr:hypothetical protein [Chitinophagales bacterium]